MSRQVSEQKGRCGFPSHAVFARHVGHVTPRAVVIAGMVPGADKACQLKHFRVDTLRRVTYSCVDFGHGLSTELRRPTTMNRKLVAVLLVLGLAVLVAVPMAFGQAPHPAGGEANLKIPDLGQVEVAGTSGRALLMLGLGV